MEQGTLRLWPIADDIIRLTYSPSDTFPDEQGYVITKTSWPKVEFKLEQKNTEAVLSTTALRIVVRREDGDITYFDSSGQLLDDANRWLTPVTVNGEKTYHAEAFINMYGSPEAIYGLGQHQAGVWNYRGESVDLSQENTNIAIPVMLSSKGYGIFWNNTSRSRFNNRFANYLYISSEVADTIDYFFLYGPDFDRIISHYRQLTGPAPMFGQWAYGFWQCKNRYSSQDELLSVARKYRELHIPLDNIVQDWFWWTRKGEMTFNKNYPDPKGMIDELHSEKIHLMLSIWPYFEPGSSAYEEMDKRGWFIDKFKFAKLPYHQDKMALYDATDPQARKYYWSLIKPLFDMGVDAWWMDTIEPETEGQEENILLGHKLGIGSGDRFANLYPLLATSAVYQGQRQNTDSKRVFILARSAFAGEQRNAVTAWSGDVLSDFETFKRQIPAGLNFSLSGLPYWTTDIGGFFIGNPDDPAFRELFVRWFQFGAFSPIFRVHGTRTTNQNELWSYGPEAQKVLVEYDKLRYRLLPYIYSLAWKVTSADYTLMRPLVMDFRRDPQSWNIGDQFMFGPAILVNPVTERGAVKRHLYQPQTDPKASTKNKWYDFWTGESVTGGQSLDAVAPLQTIPLYVRAGSIVPMGPLIEYTGEKPADPIELRIYPGADGDFTLYEDAGDSYNYEKGEYSTIPLHWNDGQRTLTIGARKGQFPGMLKSRTFRLVIVRPGHGVGVGPTAQGDSSAEYKG
jgi:alpha-D-xyloside xylohydrolase